MDDDESVNRYQSRQKLAKLGERFTESADKHHDELKKQVQRLESEMQQMRKVCAFLTSQQREVSDAAVDAFVESILVQDNSAWVPDSIERAVYKKIVTLCLRALKDVLSSAKVNVGGHEVRFSLQPTAAHREDENFDTILGSMLTRLLATARVTVAGHDISFDFK